MRRRITVPALAMMLALMFVFAGCDACTPKKVSNQPAQTSTSNANVQPTEGQPKGEQPGEQEQDPLRQMTEQADRGINIITAAFKTKRALAQDGLLKPDVELPMTRTLGAANGFLLQFGKRARKYTTFDATARDDLLLLSEDFAGTVREMNAQALLVTNPKAREQINGIAKGLEEVSKTFSRFLNPSK